MSNKISFLRFQGKYVEVQGILEYYDMIPLVNTETASVIQPLLVLFVFIHHYSILF